jgi:hypothetical protein
MAKDDRYVDATAVEYFSIHDLPPIEGPRGQREACLMAYRHLGPASTNLRLKGARTPCLQASGRRRPSGGLFRPVCESRMRHS